MEIHYAAQWWQDWAELTAESIFHSNVQWHGLVQTILGQNFKVWSRIKTQIATSFELLPLVLVHVANFEHKIYPILHVWFLPTQGYTYVYVDVDVNGKLISRFVCFVITSWHTKNCAFAFKALLLSLVQTLPPLCCACILNYSQCFGSYFLLYVCSSTEYDSAIVWFASLENKLSPRLLAMSLILIIVTHGVYPIGFRITNLPHLSMPDTPTFASWQIL